jgi:2-polyprenyl-3-methyl-5-hydroxy-6-metoxy-1,4-benzoquinol methylase
MSECLINSRFRKQRLDHARVGSAMMVRDKRELASHFAFGENWLSFQAGVAEASVAEAERGLAKLLPREEITGRGFLDVGCGSGLSMLAALRLGAREVIGVDIDPASVRAARALLGRHAPGGNWRAEEASVLDLSPETHGRHEVVHSWGVLHHTGAMWDAIDRVCRLVAPGGRLALALYRRTPFCPLWTREKRLYARAHPAVQAAIRGPFKAALLLRVAAGGRNPAAYVRDYRTRRGMDWGHDVHDWLGGYPYESVRPAELRTFLADHGLDVVRAFEEPTVGLFGSACNEWVAASPAGRG